MVATHLRCIHNDNMEIKTQATLVAPNKVVKSDFLKNSNFGLTRYLIDLADFWHVVLEWCPKY